MNEWITIPGRKYILTCLVQGKKKRFPHRTRVWPRTTRKVLRPTERVVTERTGTLVLHPDWRSERGREDSPLHTLLWRAESQQISNDSTPLSVQLSQPIVTRQREAAQRLPWIDSEPAIPAKQILTPIAKQPRSNKVIRKIQLTINNSTPPDHSLDDTWGHQLTPIDHSSTLRLIFNNVQGLHLQGDIMITKYSLSTASSLSASVLCLAETNVNWRHKQANPFLRDILQKTWRNYTYA